jgi:Transmembrane domain of unknown function (DUF3566)
MTERSAEQAAVDTRPDTHDTARIPLAERLQRRISATADDRRATSQAPRKSARVLPPPPPEQIAEQERARAEAEREAQLEAQREAQRETQRQAQFQEAQRQAALLPAAAPVPVAPPTATTRRTSANAAPVRGPRRARLRLSRIDPWSVMKVSFLLSIAFGIVTIVSVFMVWSVLGAAGVWSSINNTVSDTVSSGNTTSTFNIEDYLGMSRVLGFTMLVSVIDVVLITAIATLGAFLYNMAASLLGGVEVTLTEDHA